LAFFIVAALAHVAPMPLDLAQALVSIDRWSGVVLRFATLAQVPDAARAGLLSTLAAIAVFLTGAALPAAARRRLAVLTLAVGVVSVVLGLLQLAQGPNSPIRLFRWDEYE
jgi:hypothetical protein